MRERERENGGDRAKAAIKHKKTSNTSGLGGRPDETTQTVPPKLSNVKTNHTQQPHRLRYVRSVGRHREEAAAAPTPITNKSAAIASATTTITTTITRRFRAHLINLGVKLLVHDVLRHRAAPHELFEDLPAVVAVHQTRARKARLERLLGESVVERLLVMIEPATNSQWKTHTHKRGVCFHVREM